MVVLDLKRKKTVHNGLCGKYAVLLNKRSGMNLRSARRDAAHYDESQPRRNNTTHCAVSRRPAGLCIMCVILPTASIVGCQDKQATLHEVQAGAAGIPHNERHLSTPPRYRTLCDVPPI